MTENNATPEKNLAMEIGFEAQTYEYIVTLSIALCYVIQRRPGLINSHENNEHTSNLIYSPSMVANTIYYLLLT